MSIREILDHLGVCPDRASAGDLEVAKMVKEMGDGPRLNERQLWMLYRLRMR